MALYLGSAFVKDARCAHVSVPLELLLAMEDHSLSEQVIADFAQGR